MAFELLTATTSGLPVFLDSATSIGTFGNKLLSNGDTEHRSYPANYNVIFHFGASVSGTPTVQQNTCAPGSPPCVPTGWVASGMVVNCTGDTPGVGDLNCTFTPAPKTTYRFDFTGIGAGSPTFDVRILLGDIDNSGCTDGVDSAMVVGVWGGGGYTWPTDINQDGLSDGVDDAMIVGVWGSPDACAP